MYENNFSQGFDSTRFKDIDEGLRFQIVEFIKLAGQHRINGELIKGYNSMRSIFELIQPVNFNHKDLLIQYTEQINFYLNNVGVKPIDLAHQIKIGQQQFELKELIDNYYELIPHCLQELSLYLRIVKRNDDPDLEFSEQTFNDDKSLLDYKKEILKTLKNDDLLVYLTPRQIHDVHARILIDVTLRKKRDEVI
jgi:hypothetical protein